MGDRLLTAREWAEMMAAPVRDRTYREITGLGPLIAEWLDYKRLQNRSDATLDVYERDLAGLAKRHPNLAVGDVTSAELMNYLAAFTPSQRKRARAALSEFFKWALIWDHVPADPMLRVPSIDSSARKVVETFTKPERRKLQALPELRDRALMRLLLTSGIRDGEARKIQGRHVWFEIGALKVFGKGRRDRLIPLPPRTLDVLDELIQLEGVDLDDYLWYTRQYSPTGMLVRRRRPLVYSSFHRWWVRSLGEAGVVYRPANYKTHEPGLHNPHVTRHTYATEYLRRGGKIDRLSRLLGHSSVAITEEYYSHLVLTDLAEDVDFVFSADDE